jgi:small-conductance mechanosensitive channel
VLDVEPTPSPAFNVESTLAVEWWVTNGPKIAEGALRIALTLIIAVIVRFLLRRLIDRMTRGNGGRKPKLLKPLRERAPQALGALVSERREQRAKTIGSVLKSFVTIIVFGVAFIQVLTELGMNPAPILTSAGILGVAIGFGAQNLVKDFLSGMFMMLEDQYGVGDVVDLGPATGTVESVALRITTTPTAPSGTSATARSCGSATRRRASRWRWSTCRSGTARTWRRPPRCWPRPWRTPRARSSWPRTSSTSHRCSASRRSRRRASPCG